MKKITLLVLFFALSNLSSQNKQNQPSGFVDFGSIEMERNFTLGRAEFENQNSIQNKNLPKIFLSKNPEQNSQILAASFATLTTLSNVYGLLSSEASPLQYNNDVNAVTCFFRKGPGYTASPANNTGAIVAFLGKNFGTLWDSTCIWSDPNYLGRTPQGGIYNPFGNTNINQAYVVGSGPVITVSGTWIGSFYACKSLSVAGTGTPGIDQQVLFANLLTYSLTQGRHHFSKNNFSATDDNRVRSLASVLDDPNLPIPSKPRGVMLTKGLFNAGIFTWTTDSFCPAVMTKTSNVRYINHVGYQAWNELGNIGYVVVIGIKAGATGSNKSMQPIIYKTTNSGTTWAMIPSIDFNLAAYSHILNKLSGVQNNWCTMRPYFNAEEGIACAVDANNKLHIVSTILSASHDQQDSLNNVYKYLQNGDEYYWRFTPNNYPYIYDFYGDGSAPWAVNVIDSLSSQGAGWKDGAPGYNDNPWDALPPANDKVPIPMRIQVARTADGQHLLYTYAESDTNFTNQQKKYNTLPNVKARTWKASNNTISEKISLTQGAGQNINVISRAMLHFISPAVTATTIGSSVVFTVPITVANSNPYSQATNNRVYYENATPTFSNYLSSALPSGTLCVLGTNEKTNIAHNLVYEIFPNPAENNIEIRLNFNAEKIFKISIQNILGQPLFADNFISKAGNYTIPISLSQLPSGVFFVSIECDGAKSTQKFIKR